MEDEKSQSPDHQFQSGDGLKAIYDVYMDDEEDGEWEADQKVIAAPVYDDVHMEEEKDVVAAAAEEEEADRQNRAAAVAADEDMAHRLYIQDLMGMDEWQLRDMDRPSLRSALEMPLSDFPSSSSSRAGVGANTTAQGNFSAGTPQYALNLKEPVGQPYVPSSVRARWIFESAQGAESGNSRIPGPLEVQEERGKGPLEVEPEKGKGPLEIQAEKSIQEILATTVPSASNGGLRSSLARPAEAEREAVTNTTRGIMRFGPRDFATTPARKTVHFKDAAAGSSSTQRIPGGDGKVAAVPGETPPPAPANVVRSAGCGVTIAPRKPTVVSADDDPVSTKRRALLADADSAIMFAGMEEVNNNNSWYESIVVPDDDEKPEQVEMQDLDESLQQCLQRSEPYKPAATVAQGPDEFSLEDFCQRWDITPADIEPDEPPSTRAPKVPPLADHEVPTFDCGICIETLPVFDLFHGLPCNHKFCASCMTTYVEGRIRSSELPIPCPDPACGRGEEGGGRGVLHPEMCKKAIDYAAFGDWGARLTESALPPDRRAYCPNRQCGVLLETSGEVEPIRAPCPACGHALCATCGMEWNSDGAGLGAHDCTKGPDAALVRQLAHDRQWKQCPSCKMFVERIDGCNRMTCRCRFVFCYRCGNAMYRGQAGGAGLETCRCLNAGLAFAMAHHHQAHANIVDQAVQLPPVPVQVDLNLEPEQMVELNMQMQQPRWDDADPAEEEEVNWFY
uniref:Uncharacterized protein n=2 Tax=Avena sativa TaxID=4498 RepID=A0ACD5Y523_AVESA